MPAGDAGLEQGSVALLPDTYSAMQAVIERARELVEIDPGVWVRPDWAEANRRLIVAIRALDGAQAAQPEGEPR